MFDVGARIVANKVRVMVRHYDDDTPDCSDSVRCSVWSSDDEYMHQVHGAVNTSKVL